MPKQIDASMSRKWNFDYHFEGKWHSETKNVIYKIENTISGKVYIGQTQRELCKRWTDYKHNLLRPIELKGRCGTNTKLKRSVQKHFKELGHVDFLRFSILEIVNHSEHETKEELIAKLKAREHFHITSYRQLHGDKVCNVLDGCTVRTFSMENKTTISKAKLAFYATDKGKELRQKLSEIHTGKKTTDETKRKQSIAHKGKRVGKMHPMFGKLGDLNPMFGRKHTPESIAAMKKNRTGLCRGTANPNTKKYCLEKNPLVSPEGEIITEIYGLAPFCKERGLHPSHMRKVLSGKQKTHKGWKLLHMCPRSLMN